VSSANLPSLKDCLERLCAGEHLTAAEAEEQFGAIVRGERSEMEIAGLLIALKAKGEHPAEIAGAARALLAAATPLDCGELGGLLVDSCGTGGDGSGTVNISTAVALLVAEAGLMVTKHGNRSISSRCGSADVLESCGICLEAPAERLLASLRAENFCFLYAPSFHPGMRHAMPVRRGLRTRTIFNLLGPLVNPSRPAAQVLGVYDPALCRPLAETLRLLGAKSALVVHGSGLDEIALHGPTQAVRLHKGELSELEIRPEDAGVKPAPLRALAGGGRDENAAWLHDLLGGGASEAQRQAVAINAGALLWIAGAAEDLKAGTERALAVLATGAAASRLERIGRLSHGARTNTGS